MRIVIGEVTETDGEYKMQRAIHVDVPDDSLDLEPKDFAKQFLSGPTQQLIAWRKEAIEHAEGIVKAVMH